MTIYRYEENLLDIMYKYSVTPRKSLLTEFEVFIGQIFGRTDAQTKRNRESSLAMREGYNYWSLNLKFHADFAQNTKTWYNLPRRKSSTMPTVGKTALSAP